MQSETAEDLGHEVPSQDQGCYNNLHNVAVVAQKEFQWEEGPPRTQRLIPRDGPRLMGNVLASWPCFLEPFLNTGRYRCATRWDLRACRHQPSLGTRCGGQARMLDDDSDEEMMDLPGPGAPSNP